MNPGAIWWGQIGNSLRLLTKVTDALRDCRSAVLQVPGTFPWRQTFYEAIDLRRSTFDGERRMVRLSWEKGQEPGEFILNELCSDSVRAEYWPGQSYAEYLGSREDLMMNEYYIWITGIHSRTDAVRWCKFVSQYRKAAGAPEEFAVFILEYDGEIAETAGVEKILYTVENYDCRVFALEAAAAADNTELRSYQAELALHICNNDPEFCFALLLSGKKLLQDPVRTAQELAFEARSSEGLPFAIPEQQQIQSAAWEAAIVLLFPILERYRIDFIHRNEGELARQLPISNSNGDTVTEPCDLEIGALYYIAGLSGKTAMTGEVDTIKLCRKVRNLLAHNKIPEYEDVLLLVTGERA